MLLAGDIMIPLDARAFGGNNSHSETPQEGILKHVGSSTDHSAWLVGDETSRLFLDLASGRRTSRVDPLTTSQLQIAHRHGLLGFLAHSADPSLRDPAMPFYLLLAAHRQMMRAALRRVLTSLSEAGVRTAVLKGPYEALSYRDPDLRTFSDIDLLVPREDLARALDVISRDPAVDDIPPKRPRADKRDIPFRDASGFNFNLDIHWDLFSYSQLRGCADQATATAWDEAVEDPDHELGPLWHLPAEVRLGFLCTHAILDHRFRLILLRDLREISFSLRPDWEALVNFAASWNLRSVTYLAWLMAAHLVLAPVPAEVLTELRPSNWPTRLLEVMLPRTDVVHFDGFRPHPVNLATVLVHDDFIQRIALTIRAPFAAPGWAWRGGSSPTGIGH